MKRAPVKIRIEQAVANIIGSRLSGNIGGGRQIKLSRKSFTIHQKLSTKHCLPNKIAVVDINLSFEMPNERVIAHDRLAASLSQENPKIANNAIPTNGPRETEFLRKLSISANVLGDKSAADYFQELQHRSFE